MPKLSVLMSAYRAERTIEMAVRSTLRALPCDAEVVVVIDGPGQSASLTALARLSDPRLKVHVSDVNLGLARQLRWLVNQTDSEIIGRMDADDVCLPWRFRASLPALACANYVFTGAIRFGSGRHSVSYPVSLNTVEIARSLLFFTPLFHSSVVARRSALAAAGGYRELPYGEDTELWTRAAALGQSMAKLAIPCIGYRLSPGQMSSRTADAALLSDPIYSASLGQLLDSLGLGDVTQANSRIWLSRTRAQELLTPCRLKQRDYIRRRMLRSARFVAA